MKRRTDNSSITRQSMFKSKMASMKIERSFTSIQKVHTHTLTSHSLTSHRLISHRLTSHRLAFFFCFVLSKLGEVVNMWGYPVL